MLKPVPITPVHTHSNYTRLLRATNLGKQSANGWLFFIVFLTTHLRRMGYGDSSVRKLSPTERAAMSTGGVEHEGKKMAPPNSLPYSRKGPEHDRLLAVLREKDGVDPHTVTLKDLVAAHPFFDQFKVSSIRGALNDVKKNLYNTRVGVAAAAKAESGPKAAPVSSSRPASLSNQYAAQVMKAQMAEGGTSDPRAITYSPVFVQSTTTFRDGREKLVMVVEMPANVQSKDFVELRINEEGWKVELRRPRGQSTSDMGYVEEVLTAFRTCGDEDACFLVEDLCKALIDKRSGLGNIIFECCSIPLIKQVVFPQKPKFLICVCPDGSSALVALFECPRKNYFEEDDEEPTIIHAGSFKKQRRSLY